MVEEETPDGELPRGTIFLIALLLGFAGGFAWVAF